ncbi:MAG: class I SAM-dependent methyltransferase [Bacteroidia bacterium]|nr:class I SAM-dependent methyltransferase [Bacteroidia bacterium]
MKEFWNSRFGAEEYAYGETPNVFFKQQLDTLPAGKLLMPAEGEGRNAVYAATRGWQVTAFDISEEGRKKALRLAEKRGTSLEYLLQSFGETVFPEGSFDCVGLIYAHAPANWRPVHHRKAVSFLRPGGTIILEGFSKTQLGNPSGGPQDISMLFSEEELRDDFAGLENLQIWYEETTLDEGPYHRGKASLVRLIGQKPQ